jgi:folate-dependent phosphoribosylglycinamide formyltransferase PurN
MSELGRVGILISGRGSNMVSLVEGMRAGEIRAEPAVVISNRPKAAGLQKAAEFGVPTEVISHKKIKPRQEHERHVIEALHRHRVDLVCLAGYMRLLSSTSIPHCCPPFPVSTSSSKRWTTGSSSAAARCTSSMRNATTGR